MQIRHACPYLSFRQFFTNCKYLSCVTVHFPCTNQSNRIRIHRSVQKKHFSGATISRKVENWSPKAGVLKGQAIPRASECMIYGNRIESFGDTDAFLTANVGRITMPRLINVMREEDKDCMEGDEKIFFFFLRK